METTNYKITHNPEKKRYELHVDEQVAVAEYIEVENDILVLAHVGVPKSLEGKGIGSAVTKAALEGIKAQGKWVYPSCPFVKTYILRHPEWNALVRNPG